MLPFAHPVFFQRGRGKVLFAAEMVIKGTLRHIRCLQNVSQPRGVVPVLMHQSNAHIDQVVTRRFCSHQCLLTAEPQKPEVQKASRMGSALNPITNRRFLTRKVRTQSFARRLVLLPVSDIRERGNGNQLMLVEPGEGCIHHILSGHHDLAG